MSDLTPERRAKRKHIGTLRDRWLLFNWGTFRGCFRTRAEAVAEAKESLGSAAERWSSYFQVIKGDVALHADEMPPMWKRERTIR